MASPTEWIVAESQAPLSVVDAEGHTIEFRRPSALDRLRLFKALGPGLSANDRYIGYAMLAFHVTGTDTRALTVRLDVSLTIVP